MRDEQSRALTVQGTDNTQAEELEPFGTLVIQRKTGSLDLGDLLGFLGVERLGPNPPHFVLSERLA